MVYEDNLDALRKHHTELYSFLTKSSYKERKKVMVEYAKNGSPIVAVEKNGRKQYLNSKYNPEYEAEVFVQDYLKMPDLSILVMYGFSTGIFAKKYLQKAENKVTCIVYEPDIHVFLEVLKNIDITELLNDGRFRIVVNAVPNTDIGRFVLDVLKIENMKTNRYVQLPKYQEIYAEEYTRYKKQIYEANLTMQTRINTYATLGTQMAWTAIQNLRYLPGCRSGMDYVNVFPEGMSAIVVAAGPSLEKNIHLLKEAKGKALIIAVDHAMPMLAARGITPDIVICVDNKKSPKLFEAPMVQDCMFFADACMNTEVLDFVRPKNLVFYSGAVVTWGKLFEQVGSELRTTYSGGSVAIDAFVLLLVFGFKRIVLTGQDLALADGKYYADQKDEDKKKYKEIKVRGIYGGEVVTTREFVVFKSAFENLIALHPECEVIDATEGGAYIEGSRVMTLRDVIDSYCIEEYDIEKILKSPRRLFVGEDEQLVARAYEEMKEHFETDAEIFRTAAEASMEGAHLLTNQTYNIEALQEINSKIQKADRTYTCSEEELMLQRYAGMENYQLFTDLYEKEQEDDVQESIRLYEKCNKFFHSLADAANDLITVVENAERKMKKDKEIREAKGC